MDCVILAGGLGTRLRSILPHTPKVLAPIRGRPFLSLLVQQLIRSHCISKIIFALGYCSNQVIELFKDYPFPIEFSCETKPLGTGGAVRLAMKKVESNPFFVMNGDSYFDISFTKMLLFHRMHEAEITLAYRKADDTRRFGILKVSSRDRILSFQEKEGTMGFINGGIYLFQQEIFDEFPCNDSFSLEYDRLPFLLRQKMFGFFSDGIFIDIGTPQSFLVAQELLKTVSSTAGANFDDRGV